MENPNHHISMVIRIGNEKMSAPPNARASPIAKAWAATFSPLAPAPAVTLLRCSFREFFLFTQHLSVRV
jgi:hypothetical protein